MVPAPQVKLFSLRMSFILSIGLVFNSAWAVDLKEPKSQVTYYYGPEPSTLTGTIRTVTFPGPPNYDSIKSGDEAEHCWILFLDKPVSVLPKKESKEYFEDPLQKVQKIQLVIHSDLKLKVIKNHHVRITGTFFSAHTGHHHTEVLMEVNRIERLK